jgi:hypothetical protein
MVHLRSRRTSVINFPSQSMQLGKILPIRLQHNYALCAFRNGTEVSPSRCRHCRSAGWYLEEARAAFVYIVHEKWKADIHPLRWSDRMYSIYERSKKVLILLLGLAAIDYALQMSANHAATCESARRIHAFLQLYLFLSLSDIVQTHQSSYQY